MMHPAFYVRVSTVQQVQTQTIDQQIDRLRAYCREQHWTWDDRQVFRDDGVSGSRLTRPGLDRLRDQVANGSVDRVVVTAPDRLARKYVHQMLLIEEFERSGCQVVFVEHPMSQDPNDQLLLQIRGAVAEYERSLITERLRRGRQQKYRAGLLLPWTQPPYGYILDPDRPRDLQAVRLDPDAAAWVAELYAWYLEPGQSLAGIAKRLMQRHVPAPKGGARWTTATVRRILTNPAYTGVVYAGRSQVRPIGPRRSPLAPVGQRPHSSSPTPPDTWILVGQVPPVVAQAQFDQVQAKLATNQQFARRNNTAHRYLLRALVSCGLCRLACGGQTRRGYAYYTCAGKWHPVLSSRDERCPARLTPMHQLDAVVWTDLCAVLRDPEILGVAVQRAQSGAWLPQELQARRENLRQAEARLRNQVERLTQAYLEQIVSLEEYRRRRQELDTRLDALAQQRRAVEVQVDRRQEVLQVVEQVEAFRQRVAVGLDTATFDQKRQVIELLIDRVVVTNDEVEIRYVIPTTPHSEHTRFYQLRSAYCRTLSPDLSRRMSAGVSADDRGAGAHDHPAFPAFLQ